MMNLSRIIQVVIFIVFLGLGYFLVPKSNVIAETPGALPPADASVNQAADIEAFHQQNNPLLLAFLGELKVNQKSEGLKLTDGRVVLEDTTYLGHNMKYGAYIFQHHELYQAVVATPDIELPTCDNFDETTSIAGEVHTYKTSKDYPVFVKCPPKEWLENLK